MLHKQKEVQINKRTVEIDEAIIPTIMWLNNLPGVETKGCCQGGDYEPYVDLGCNSEESLNIIRRTLKNFRRPAAKGWDYSPKLLMGYIADNTYQLRWASHQELLKFQEFLKLQADSND